MERQVHATPDKQVSLTDPDARAMATSGRGTGMVGYNVQTAVDAEHHLIVAHEVTNLGHDRTQLEPMALKARDATGCEEITALADRGYFNGEQVLACEGTGILPCVPKTETSSRTKRGFFTRHDFIFDAQADHYVCPAGAQLTRSNPRPDRKDEFDEYRHLSACFTCALKPRCTPDKLRRIKRWKREDVMDKMQARLDRMPDAMAVRRQTVEHPFGTLKSWMAKHPLPNQNPRKGPNRDEPPRSGLQHEADDPDVRCQAAPEGDQGIVTRLRDRVILNSPQSQPADAPINLRVFTRPRSAARAVPAPKSGRRRSSLSNSAVS